MVKIYGASDDLIEVVGDIRQEFYAIDAETAILGFSDGTLLSVEFDNDGIWRIRRLAKGTAGYKHTEAVDAGIGHSDTVELDGEIAWVAFGRAWAKAEGAKDA